MSQRKSGTPVGQSSYTPVRKPAPTKRTGPFGPTTIAIIGMAVVLVVLLGGGWLLTQNPAATPTPTTQPVVSIWDYSAGTVNAISVQDITSTTTVQFSTDRWRITAPTQEDASEVDVDSVAGTFKTLTAQSKVADNPTDLGQYGLASPAITVTVIISGATPPNQQLFVGNASVDGTGYYVKPASVNTVYLVYSSSIDPVKGWLTTLPIAEPTATPLAADIITPTLTVTGTPPTAAPTSAGAISVPTGTPTTSGSSSTAPTAAAAITPQAAQGTAVTTGTQPPVGASPVSTQPAIPTTSPGAGDTGGGTASGTGVVVTATP